MSYLLCKDIGLDSWHLNQKNKAKQNKTRPKKTKKKHDEQDWSKENQKLQNQQYKNKIINLEKNCRLNKIAKKFHHDID